MTVTQATSSPSISSHRASRAPRSAVWGLPCQLTIMQMVFFFFFMQMPWSLHDGELVQKDKQSP